MLIEGDPYRDTGEMSSQAVRGAMVAVTVFWCIPVLASRDARDSATLLRMIARQNERGAKHLNQRHQRAGRNLAERRVHVLQGLPGIGAKKAQRLLDQFGTVRRVMAASGEAMREVKGLGEKTTRKICRVLETTGAVDC